MKAQIRPNRLDISNRFPLASFTIRTDGQPRVAEVVVATSPDLFEKKEGRNRTTFFSTREHGPLSIPRAEAVYTLPPEILARFADAEKLWFALATAPAGKGDREWQVDVSPTASSPYISLAGLTDGSLRRVRMFPRRGLQAGFGNNNADVRLTWAGDAAQPGMERAGGENRAANGVAEPAPSTAPSAPQPAAEMPYDDGFGPLPPRNGALPVADPVSDGEATVAGNANGPDTIVEGQSSEDELTPEARDRLDDQGIDGPVPDGDFSAPATASAMGDRPRALRAVEYPGARLMPSPAYTRGRYRWSNGQREEVQIDRIAIHITDSGQSNYLGSWFTREEARSSAHYMVDRNGLVRQFVREQDTAWHAGNRAANRRSIGIEHVAVKRGGARYGNRTLPHEMPSDVEYEASAKLVAHLCRKYGITPSRETILGHNEINPNTGHGACPTGAWDWDHYMPMVLREYDRTPAVSQGFGAGAPAVLMGGEFDGERALRWIREKVEQAADAAGSDVSGPSVHHLSEGQSETFIDAWKIAFLLNPGLRNLPQLAQDSGVTLSIGPVLNTPLFGAGVGVVFAPNGRVGLFGQGDISLDVSGLAEFARSLKAVLHGSIKLGYNSGGISGFESIRKVATITVGEELVVGAEIWLDGSGRGIGGAASIGVGFALQFAASKTTAFGQQESAVALSGGWTGQRVIREIERAIEAGARAAAEDVSPPRLYELGDYSDEFAFAWKAAFLFTMPALAALPDLAKSSGKTISVGPMLDTPLFGAGVGVAFAPDGKIAIFGRGDFAFDAGGVAELISSLRAVLAASFKIGMNNGGLAGFRNVAKAASISGGEEVVVGAEVWLDSSGSIVGGAVRIGVGFAIQFSANSGQALEARPMSQTLGGDWSAEAILRKIEQAVRSGVQSAAEDVNPPALYRLGGLSGAFITAWTVAYFIPMPALAGLPALARASGKTISVGPTLDTPLFGAGVGVLFTPDGQVALFGRGDISVDASGIAEFIATLKATLAASFKIGFNNGGIAGFERIKKAASISGGEEVVLGAEAWLDSGGDIVGGAVKIGVGFSIQLSTTDAYTMSNEAEELREHAQKIGGSFAQRVDDLLTVGYPKADIGSMLDALDNRTGSAAAHAFGDDNPLDPGVGGMSLHPDALEIGDIIVSTTDAAVSRGIRAGSGSEVSHAMLYVGQGGQVIEAIGDGVVLRPLSEALDDATLAVAFRVPGLNGTKRQQIADAAAQYLDRPYNYKGIVRWGLYNIDRSTCSLLPDRFQARCRNFAGRLNLGPGTREEFFCSQLVLQAYEDVGHRLTTEPAHWSSPEDLVRLRLRNNKISYVGHLKTPAPRRSFFGHSFSADEGAMVASEKPQTPPDAATGAKPESSAPPMEQAPAKPANSSANPTEHPSLAGDPVENHAFGPGITISKQTIDKGKRSYELCQLRGFVQPQAGNAAQVDAIRAEPVLLDDWPYIKEGDHVTQAGIAIDWAHKGGAVGEIGITPLDGASPNGWDVSVRADLLPGTETPGKAQVKVRVSTVFSKDGEPTQTAVSEVLLNGDGQSHVQHGVGETGSGEAAAQPAPTVPPAEAAAPPPGQSTAPQAGSSPAPQPVEA